MGVTRYLCNAYVTRYLCNAYVTRYVILLLLCNITQVTLLTNVTRYLSKIGTVTNLILCNIITTSYGVTNLVSSPLSNAQPQPEVTKPTE